MIEFRIADWQGIYGSRAKTATALREALESLIATPRDSDQEQYVIDLYNLRLIKAAQTDAYGVLFDVTIDYLQVFSSEKRMNESLGIWPFQEQFSDKEIHTLRETVRAGWLWLFRQAAELNVQAAENIVRVLNEYEDYADLRDAAAHVHPKFRNPAPKP